ncbi:MAG TPA: Gfo/Idh/MocA family oxidoreductase [bacterium]|nr:Gfo/Idh/MocA family oxidoreductase [bacterium]
MTTHSNRRSFIQRSGWLAGASFLSSKWFGIAASSHTYKAAVIGRTGGGDYGHGLDTIFNGLENVTLAAVADADPVGLEAAARRTGAPRAYLDYHEMLEKEKPDLVSIASRQPDGHREMALAALEAGAHLYIEKPITEFPREADEILAAAQKHGCKIAVAHTRRFMDPFLLIQQLIQEEYFGPILEFRFQGKQDARVGGEDLIVLGSHDMDIMRFFLHADPLWCFASVTVDGRDATPSDVRRGQEPYTVAGETVRAEYQFPGNILYRWSSVKGPAEWNRPFDYKEKRLSKWGFEIFGTKRILTYQESVGAFVLDCPFLTLGDPDMTWRPLESVRKYTKPAVLNHPIRNLIHAIETGTPPQCSGEDARWAVEMVCAVYHAHKAKARVPFPLRDREHPLREWIER